MSEELKNHYGENTSYLCYEGHLTLHDFYDEDNAGYVLAGFDIECDEGRANVDTIALLESAHVVMEAQSTELEQLRKELEEFKQERENVSVKYGDAWFDGFLRAAQIQAEDENLDEYQDHDIALLSEAAEAKKLNQQGENDE